MKKTYIITKDVKVPIVVNSGQAHRPAQVRYKVYRKGEMVQGELKHSNNKPAFILVGSMGVLPLNCVQEVTSVPVTSNLSGEATNTTPPKESEVVKEPKVQFRIEGFDKDGNRVIVLLMHPTKGTQKISLSEENFNNLLYQPELFDRFDI